MSLLELLDTLLIGPLKLVFEIIFVIANRVVGHPGLAIIALSLAMNILVLPLYRRADAIQEHARDVEAKLRDGAAHIKKTFSGDERMMILQAYYRQNHYKPTDALSGSVSLLLEVPFFMAAYQFLSELQLLNGVSFGPIADLGVPDGMLVIGGMAINLLPVIMTLVNVISSAIYLKGFPQKTKVQLYAMAAFFLVFLYDSPAGLVFYWTLNNVFSLVKTIFYKLKNPKKVLKILCSGLGIAALVFGVFLYTETSVKRRIFVVGMGLALQLPMLLSKVAMKTKRHPMVPNKKLFYTTTAFLAIFLGWMIPSTLIAASPLEFVDVNYFVHPIWYLVSSGALAAGTFLIWARVFYGLATPRGKAWFERILWMMCGIALINYMFFGTDLGVISPDLKYDLEPAFTAGEVLINLLVIAVAALLLYLLAEKKGSSIVAVALTAAIALGSMSGINIFRIWKAIDSATFDDQDAALEASLTLSTSGKNVVVIMLDRSLGQLVPYIFHEKPELETQFDGFTHYINTVSLGPGTNFGSPALMGGYEYSPVEMNRRDEESLASKHNEALKVMPAIFYENAYHVTVCDPVYAGYQWIPDLSIYDAYPDMHTYNIEEAFLGSQDKEILIRNRFRNFFCFSIMRSVPLVLQPNLYFGGQYNQAMPAGIQVSRGISEAEGISTAFQSRYNALKMMPRLTSVTDSEENTFLLMCNNGPHMPTLLQTPDYVPAEHVDNWEYDREHADRFVLEEESLTVQNVAQMTSYHSNMASLIQIGNWLDHLRQEGVYDNTRIILVADHGWDLNYQDSFVMDAPGGGTMDMAIYYPLLMVKDFNSRGFTTSDEFMTNADVPTLAFRDLIDDPVNPFTGKQINSSEKTAHPQYLIVSDIWDVEQNNGNTFLPSYWVRVQGDIRDARNWEFYEEETVLQEHAFPG